MSRKTLQQRMAKEIDQIQSLKRMLGFGLVWGLRFLWLICFLALVRWLGLVLAIVIGIVFLAIILFAKRGSRVYQIFSLFETIFLGIVFPIVSRLIERSWPSLYLLILLLVVLWVATVHAIGWVKYKNVWWTAMRMDI